MVSRQGKDLLRNTIRSTGYHNRLLEEDDMWRQWDLERGLTMMVTDDCLKKKLRMDQYPRPLKSSLSVTSRDNYWTRKLFKVEEKDPDRWGHSGYKELYPEEFNKKRPKSPPRSPSPSYDRRKTTRKSKKLHSHHKRKRREHAEEDKLLKTTSHRQHDTAKDRKRIRVSVKKRRSKESNAWSEPSSKTNSQSSEEEGECNKSKSDRESCSDLNSEKLKKSGASSSSSTASSSSDSDSESSEDERLHEEQLQRLARFRRHFRSCSVEKDASDDVKNNFRSDLSERIKCNGSGTDATKDSDANKRRKRKN